MTGFFEHQDRARRNTRLLLGLMLLGVLGMGAGLFTVAVFAESVLSAQRHPALAHGPRFDPLLLLACVAGTMLVVLAASAFRLLQLRGGGRQVAEMLGGRLVSGAPRDTLERRLLNVVEEMSIASGVPVPEVFVLDDEPGINAFAAGLGFDDAAIAVTRGCLQALDRDELQGVIAHEFSHVLNGDMRLNMHLMGVVFGIVCIGLLGRILMRSTRSVGRSSKKNPAAAVALAGLAIYLIGLVGELCGKLIKAAVSRQREFLADASAVQFTRNPAGVAGALKKIGGYGAGSRIAASRAEEASHFFFGDIHKSLFGPGPFATHPSLALRIRRLDPSFDGQFPAVQSASTAALGESVRGFAALGQPAAQPSTQPAQPSLTPEQRPKAAWIAEHVGTTSPGALERSHALIEALPEALLESARSPFAATAVVYAMLLSSEPELVARQRERLDALAGRALREEAMRLRPAIAALPARSRLPLAELCAPALRQLSHAQRRTFTRTLDALIAVDRQLSTFEYVLAHSLGRRLDVERPTASGRVRRTRLSAVQPQAQLLLSLLAHAGAHEKGAAERAFAAGAAKILQQTGLRLHFGAAPQLATLGLALEALATLVPEEAALLVDACAMAVLEDRRVDDAEAGLLQVVCEDLGCPLPLPVLKAAS